MTWRRENMLRRVLLCCGAVALLGACTTPQRIQSHILPLPDNEAYVARPNPVGEILVIK